MRQEPRYGDWFTTYCGVKFYPYDPRPTDILLGDIAHHLSLLCRFNGAIRAFYSVGQHSVLVSQNVPKGLELWGLLHDASETYLGDMVRPLKMGMPQYKEAELRVMQAIATRFGLTMPEPPEVKQADNLLLFTERRDLLIRQHQWSWEQAPLKKKIVPWSPVRTEAVFLKRFAALVHPLQTYQVLEGPAKMRYWRDPEGDVRRGDGDQDVIVWEGEAFDEAQAHSLYQASVVASY